MTEPSFRDVLREALDGVPGWRLRARRLLGIAVDAQCPVCARWFDKSRSGTGKTCGRVSCQREYKRRKAKGKT